MKVERMVAYTPRHSALLAGCRSLVCLTLNAEIHNMVSADGAVVHDYVPSPESHGVPLLDFESLFAFGLVRWPALLLGQRSWYRRVRHINVGHDRCLDDRGLHTVATLLLMLGSRGRSATCLIFDNGGLGALQGYFEGGRLYRKNMPSTPPSDILQYGSVSEL